MFDCYIEVKSDCEGEYCYTTGEYFWYADLLYLYDEESSIPVARYENDAEEFGELSPLKNLGVMIRTVAEDISLAFGGLFTGNFEEFSFYMEWARFDFGSFFDYYF